MLWVRIALMWGVIDTTLCDKVCQWLAAGWWLSLGTPVSSTNKTECHNITEILLKVALNTITLSLPKKKTYLIPWKSYSFICIGFWQLLTVQIFLKIFFKENLLSSQHIYLNIDVRNILYMICSHQKSLYIKLCPYI